MKTNEQTNKFDTNFLTLAETQTDDSELSPISPSTLNHPHPFHPNLIWKICQHFKPLTNPMLHTQAKSVFSKSSRLCKLSEN